MGRLNSAASSVAVPLAISVTSQAASAACDWPSTIFSPPASPAAAGRLLDRRRRRGHRRARRSWSRGPRLAARSAAAAKNVGGQVARPPRRGCPAGWRAPRPRRASPARARAAARSGVHRDHVGQRMADVGRAMPCCASSSGSNGKMHSTWSAARLIFSTRSGRQAQIEGQTKCTVLMPRALQRRFEVQVEIGRIDADEDVGRLAQQALAQLVADADDLAVVAQHLDVAAHGQLLVRPPGLEAVRAPSAGRRCRRAAAAGQRACMPSSSRPASRSPDASPATMAKRGCAPCGISARCRAWRAARKPLIRATSGAASGVCAGQCVDRVRGRRPASGLRGTAACASA